MAEEQLRSGEATPVLYKKALRWGRNFFAVASVGIGVGLLGANQDPAHIQIGPHDAEIALTLDGMATLDADPIASLRSETPAGTPPFIGVDIELGSVPSSEGSQANPPTIEGLKNPLESSDTQELATYYSNAGSDLEKIPAAVRNQFLAYALPASLVAFAVPAILGKKVRQEVVEAITQPRRAAALIALIGLVGMQQYVVHDQEPAVWVPAHIESDLIDSPLLEGLEISGEYGERVLGGINMVFDYYEETMRFYNFATERFEYMAKNRDILSDREGYVTVGFFTDKHCNNAVDQFIGSVMNASGAKVLLSGGDEFISGTKYEGFCVRYMENFVDSSVTKIAVPSNHASRKYSLDHLEDAGFEVLRTGDSTEVEDLVIVGGDDPRMSPFGSPTTFYKGETLEGVAAQVRETACQENANIVLVHDPHIAESVLETTCPTSGTEDDNTEPHFMSGLSGHVHKFNLKDVQSSQQTRPLLVGDNISGAKQDSFTFAKPGANVTMTLLQYHQESGRLAYYQNISITPTGSAEIGRITEVPFS